MGRTRQSPGPKIWVLTPTASRAFWEFLEMEVAGFLVPLLHPRPARRRTGLSIIIRRGLSFSTRAVPTVSAPRVRAKEVTSTSPEACACTRKAYTPDLTAFQGNGRARARTHCPLGRGSRPSRETPSPCLAFHRAWRMTSARRHQGAIPLTLMTC